MIYVGYIKYCVSVLWGFFVFDFFLVFVIFMSVWSQVMQLAEIEDINIYYACSGLSGVCVLTAGVDAVRVRVDEVDGDAQIRFGEQLVFVLLL